MVATESFSIREYVAATRAADPAKCWPFDGDGGGEGRPALPEMEVRRFRWWGDELEAAEQGRRTPERAGAGTGGSGKLLEAKERSIAELIAAPTGGGSEDVLAGEGEGSVVENEGSGGGVDDGTAAEVPKKKRKGRTARKSVSKKRKSKVAKIGERHEKKPRIEVQQENEEKIYKPKLPSQVKYRKILQGLTSENKSEKNPVGKGKKAQKRESFAKKQLFKGKDTSSSILKEKALPVRRRNRKKGRLSIKKRSPRRDAKYSSLFKLLCDSARQHSAKDDNMPGYSRSFSHEVLTGIQNLCRIFSNVLAASVAMHNTSSKCDLPPPEKPQVESAIDHQVVTEGVGPSTPTDHVSIDADTTFQIPSLKELSNSEKVHGLQDDPIKPWRNDTDNIGLSSAANATGNDTPVSDAPCPVVPLPNTDANRRLYSPTSSRRSCEARIILDQESARHDDVCTDADFVGLLPPSNSHHGCRVPHVDPSRCSNNEKSPLGGCSLGAKEPRCPLMSPPPTMRLMGKNVTVGKISEEECNALPCDSRRRTWTDEGVIAQEQHDSIVWISDRNPILPHPTHMQEWFLQHSVGEAPSTFYNAPGAAGISDDPVQLIDQQQWMLMRAAPIPTQAFFKDPSAGSTVLSSSCQYHEAQPIHGAVVFHPVPWNAYHNQAMFDTSASIYNQPSSSHSAPNPPQPSFVASQQKYTPGSSCPFSRTSNASQMFAMIPGNSRLLQRVYSPRVAPNTASLPLYGAGAPEAGGVFTDKRDGAGRH